MKPGNFAISERKDILQSDGCRDLNFAAISDGEDIAVVAGAYTMKLLLFQREWWLQGLIQCNCCYFRWRRHCGGCRDFYNETVVISEREEVSAISVEWGVSIWCNVQVQACTVIQEEQNQVIT